MSKRVVATIGRVPDGDTIDNTVPARKRSSGSSSSRKASASRWSHMAGEDRYRMAETVSTESFHSSPWTVVASVSDNLVDKLEAAMR